MRLPTPSEDPATEESASSAADGSRLGVVIPTLNEEAYLPALLADLEPLGPSSQIVVSDGGSADQTRELAAAAGARVITGPRGRAVQLNAGARALETPWLLFLHADSRLPSDAVAALEHWLDTADPRTAAHFRFALQGGDFFWRFIEFGQAIRERLYGLPYGDQGLLVSRVLFEEVKGYPAQALMEDVALIRKLRRAGAVRRIPAVLVTSPRRYEREGRWRAWLRNVALMAMYLVGLPPRFLQRWYPPEPEPPPGHDAAADQAASPRRLVVFAKNPVPGQVKTRLAAEIGAEEAARVYRRIGRRVVDRIRGGSYGVVICYDPPEARDAVTRWLGHEGLTFVAQAQGDLSMRLDRAFQEAFGTAQRVCVIGTDAPDVERALVEEAFRALDEADVVLGPAEDGGYYLMALSRPAPALFRGIPWSTSDVLEVTLLRAHESGLTTALLRTLSDVDTAADLPQSRV